MKDSVSAGTAARYNVSLRQVDPYLGGLYIDQITRVVLSDMVRSRKAHGASNATINRDLTAVSQVIGAAIEWGAAEHNPAGDFNRKLLTKERRDPIAAPSAEAINAVVARAPGRLADMIRFLDLVGCRQEEAASLEWRQIDMLAATCHFPKTKTGRPRTIRLSAAAVSLLNVIPRQIRSRFVFWHGSEGLRYLNVASRFRQIAKDAGQSFRCHDLRHGYAIRELQAGRDIYDLSRHLGHSSVKTTEIYLGHVPGGFAAKRDGVQSGVQ
jgi:integrase